MGNYQGIPIEEYKLWLLGGFSILLVCATLAALIFGVYVLLGGMGDCKKERKSIRKLRERADTDAVAKARLEKLQKKQKKRRQKGRADLIGSVALCVLLATLGVAMLLVGVIPPIKDYVQKDYVVYTGAIKVVRYTRRSYIELPDGTRIKGAVGFDEDDTYGTVVYAKSSKCALGGQK